MSQSQQQIERKVARAGAVLALALAGVVGAAVVSNSRHPDAPADEQSIASAVVAADPHHPTGGSGLFGPAVPIPVTPARPVRVTQASGDPRLAHGFGGLQVGPPVTYTNLTIYPVSRTVPVRADSGLSPLDEAMGNGTVSVAEPSLSVTNMGPQPTYVPGGSVVPGGNQDQGVAVDAVVPVGGRTVSIASFCVEQGRSFGTSSEFHRDVAFAIPAVRYAMQVSGDQQQVWDAIARATDHFGAQSETGAYHALVVSPSAQAAVAPYEAALSAPARTVGAIVAINGRLICADVYRDPALFAQVWPSLRRSYALQAAMSTPHGPSSLVGRGDAARWLASLDGAPGAQDERQDAPGVEGARVAAAAGAGVRTAQTGARSSLLHEAFWTDAAAM